MPETIVRVILPEMGESVTEGSVVEWRVKVGQWIDAGETLVDVTTDKVDVEVPATASGLVTKIAVEEGATIEVGGMLCEIDESASKPAGGSAAAPANGGAASPPPIAVTPAGYGSSGATVPTTAAASAGAGVAGSGLASHQAKRLADRLGLDWNAVKGTGPNGLVVRDDVIAAERTGTAKPRTNGAAAGPSVALPALPPLSTETKTTTLKGPTAALVGYMEQSLTLPTATSFRTLSVGTLDKKRAELNGALKAAGRGEKISFTHLIAYALVRAAAEQPAMCASFRRDERGTPLKIEAGIHLGLAVDATRKDGSRFLVVPVIKNADASNFAAFRVKFEEMIAKARDAKLAADDLSGATFTLTNPGGIGTAASVPRLLAGQGTILAAGALGYPPGFQKADPAALKSLGVEKIMQMTSTYDHRIIQGAQSGEFLKRVEELLAGADGFFETVAASLGLDAGGGPSGGNGVATVGHASPAGGGTLAQAAPSDELLRAVAAGSALVSAYRRHGHLAATLDPLGAVPKGDPSLDPATYGLAPAVMSAIPASVLRTKLPGATLEAVLQELRSTYSGTIAYEVEHIANIAQREWLRDYIESAKHYVTLSPERKAHFLQRLTKVETFERFMRKQYLGQKTFSIEGLDVMVPMLEEIETLLADDGVETAVIGMAHRGRLSTITHVVNRPYEEIFAEFEAAYARGEIDDGTGEDATGDVKYHHGSIGTYDTVNGKQIKVVLANNPSHLETVDGIVEGMTRAMQTEHAPGGATLNEAKAAAILIHGDAAFIGQGVVAEVLNLQELRGYRTGGTIHVIANNQVGFTTDPRDDRSTRHASDLAKGFDVPIIHVNADDVDACIMAAHMAIDFRREFKHDIIIDLIGYRRFGHNETDEPAYTQPLMYDSIKSHPTVRELYAQKLAASGEVPADRATAYAQAALKRVTDAHAVAKGAGAPGGAKKSSATNGAAAVEPVPSVSRERLLAWNDALLVVPEGFTIHPKLLRQLEKRRATAADGGEVDYGLAESLAFASLLADGTPIRLTGQDTERGTFSHRHMVFHDPKTAATFAPIRGLADAKASLEVYNSPLSEYACLAFEYGYSTQAANALVLWEAQFGDFNNGAQIVIDQFIASGQAKWGQSARLAMLLPHGYEGAGPEHSSARLERFLQLSAEGNIRVANCTTSGQYFHLLRMQATEKKAIPLIVMTPKSLLRMKAASSTLADLATGAFAPVLADPRADRAQSVERIVLCSGKIYYDLIGHASYGDARKTAIVRVELLAPFPAEMLAAVVAGYPAARQILWVQEEPKNMGAWSHVRRVADRLPERVANATYVGRPYRAAPSEGYGSAHAAEQERIVSTALAEG